MKGLAQIDPLATTVWKWLYAYEPVKAAESDEIIPDKRGRRSVYAEDGDEQQRAWHMWHDLFTTEEEAGGVWGLRRGYDRFFGQFKICPTTSTTEVKIGDVPAIWIDSQGAGKQRVILHLHGGGYTFGSARCSVEYGERLSEAVNGRCLALEYRLAPENPYPAALQDSVKAYQWLLSQGYNPQDILLSGESAGAGLAVSTAVALRDAPLPMPAGLILLSPFVDCSLQSPSVEKLEGMDPIIDRDTLTYMSTGYFQSNSPTHPGVSPVYADLRSLPPMLIQAGSKEVLIDDAARLAERARAVGNRVDLSLYDERLHIFSLYPFLPNAKKALSEIEAFGKRLWASPESPRRAAS
jgi:salicylate hydroxylase